MIPDPILLSPEPSPLSPDPSHILGFEPWAHIPCDDPGHKASLLTATRKLENISSQFKQPSFCVLNCALKLSLFACTNWVGNHEKCRCLNQQSNFKQHGSWSDNAKGAESRSFKRTLPSSANFLKTCFNKKTECSISYKIISLLCYRIGTRRE